MVSTTGLRSTASRDDRRHLIPEVIGVHLQSAPAPLGANWKGRTTPRFAPGADPVPYVSSAGGDGDRNDSPRLYMG